MDDQDEARAGNLPDWMKVCWIISAPFALLLTARIGWEKTVWTWTHGPQMVGFSLWHSHVAFALAGLISSWGLLVWSVVSLAFVAVRRKRVTATEIVMFACAAFVIIVMAVPDTFFAK